MLFMLFTDWEVCIKKNFAQDLECTDRDYRLQSIHVHSRTRAMFFYMDRQRLVNNIKFLPLKFAG